jgi:hypothetical protein
MNRSIQTIRNTRQSLLGLIKELTLDELNRVPQGFNNNIIWNLGHLVAAQQGVCYKRAGVAMRIDDSFYLLYKPESKPERFIGQEEADDIKSLFFSTLDQLEADLQNDVFGDYPAWVTRYGVPINSLDEAINFLPFHEGLHMGYIMALRRVVTAK